MKDVNPLNVGIGMLIALPSIAVLMVWAFLTRWFK